MDTLLEFLAGRDWASARAVYQEIKASDLSFSGSPQDPFLAAVAAYVEALTGDGDLTTMSTDRLTNSSWMTDFWIAVGWTLLRRCESSSDGFKRARGLMLSAVDHGLPFFRIGLDVLSDALNFLIVVDSKDEDSQRALAAVTRAALACSQDDVFTTMDVDKYLEFAKKS